MDTTLGDGEQTSGVSFTATKSSDALCETVITWRDSTREFTTWGLDTDQTVSAIKAREKMLNICGF